MIWWVTYTCVDCGREPHLSDGSLGGDIGEFLAGNLRAIWIRCGPCQTRLMFNDYLERRFFNMDEGRIEHHTSYDAIAKLAGKMVNVMERVRHIAKTGRNKEFGYDFVEESQVAQEVREAFIANRLIMIPSVVERSSEPVTSKAGSPGHLMQIKMKYTIIDAETGEGLSFFMSGDGIDYGDKGLYKAITGATKYALMKLFLIPTGDDPERDQKEEREAKVVPEHPPREPQEEPREPVRMKFGKYDGVPLNEVPTQNLRDSLDFFQKMVDDPSRDRFKKDNLSMVRAIEKEIARRLDNLPPLPTKTVSDANPKVGEYSARVNKAEHINDVFVIMMEVNSDMVLSAQDRIDLHSVGMHRMEEIRDRKSTEV